MNLLGMVLPGWVKALALVLLALALYGFGRVDGERIVGSEFSDYKAGQAVASVKVLAARTQVLREVETKYLPARERIVTQVKEIVKEVPVHVTQAADARCVVPVGLVRIHDSAFGFDADPSAAGEPDDGPAGIPLSQVAEVVAENAGACRQWREQALALRLAYEAVRTAERSKE